MLTFLLIYITGPHYETAHTRLKRCNNYRAIMRTLCSVSYQLSLGYANIIVNMVKI